jgi:predicted nuclease of predicted toxin-antitoxin system
MRTCRPKVAAPLRAAGHDVTIAREVGLRTATDQVVIETARREARVLVRRRNAVVRSRAPGREPQAR